MRYFLSKYLPMNHFQVMGMRREEKGDRKEAEMRKMKRALG